MNTPNNIPQSAIHHPPLEVLIVEDSPTQAAQLEEVLRLRGYQTQTAVNGRQALEAVRRRQPSVIISDILMPVMDGFQLCRAIKQEPGLRHIPVILLTSLSSPADVLSALEAGADFHIPKLCESEYLAAKIMDILSPRAEGGRAESETVETVTFDGTAYQISASRGQMLRLLLSTYEVAIRKNQELLSARDVLHTLNEQLEAKVQARTAALEAEIAERKQTERLLEFIAQKGWTGRPEEFFARLVEFIGRTLAVDYVFVGRLKDDQTVQTAGLYAKGQIVPDMEYATRGAPCANVIGRTLCHYGERLQELFPDDALLAQMGAQSYIGIPLMDASGQPLGLLALLDSKPMPDARLATVLLQVASVRVAGELDRSAAAAALQASEATFRAVAELSPIAIYASKGSDQKALFINKAFYEIFGFSLEDTPTVGHWWIKAFPDEKYRQQVMDQWARNIEQASEKHADVEALECVCTCKDGSKKIIVWVGKTINDEFWAFGYDLTERKRAEEALGQQAEELRARNEELERLNRAMVGREMRLIELKQQANDLADQLGRPHPYALAFMDAKMAKVIRSAPKPGDQKLESDETQNQPLT